VTAAKHSHGAATKYTAARLTEITSRASASAKLEPLKDSGRCEPVNYSESPSKPSRPRRAESVKQLCRTADERHFNHALNRAETLWCFTPILVAK